MSNDRKYWVNLVKRHGTVADESFRAKTGIRKDSLAGNTARLVFDDRFWSGSHP